MPKSGISGKGLIISLKKAKMVNITNSYPKQYNLLWYTAYYKYSLLVQSHYLTLYLICKF